MSGASSARAAVRDPLNVLRTVWGYPAFRGLQEEVIGHVLAGGDALVLMPTGGGKSLCFQVPALCLDGLTVVVSPLIALMQDQVAALAQLGVRAAMLNSTLDFRTATGVERAMREGALDLVYVAPERLKTPGFLELLGRCRLALFAIDEARVELAVRGADGTWVSRFFIGQEAILPLASLAIELPLADLYAGADSDTMPA